MIIKKGKIKYIFKVLIYVFLLLALESIIISSIAFYLTRNNILCGWDVYPSNFGIIEVVFLAQMIELFISNVIWYTFVIKEDRLTNASYLQVAKFEVIIFYIMNTLYALIIQRNTFDFNLPECINPILKYFGVFTTLIIVPMLLKLLGLKKLLFSSK
ncbi:MAG: hypothetical protein EOP45_07115 [Sphingobacteriaceae bacterium]|nr:MAG: hypothetical protein EOP45_07115 [Sphingobacteriaceae bacterium]